MKVDVRLVPLGVKASDGSIISKEVFNKYLNSNNYKDRFASKNFLGGSTHINRNDASQLDEGGVIGEGDEMLLNGNITHIVEEFWIAKDPEDKLDYMCCRLEIMDNPDEYEGKSKEYIKTLVRLLKRGVMLPVSIVIKAVWDDEDRARQIVDILGLDITLSPETGSIHR
jgi:hypothetical protein